MFTGSSNNYSINNNIKKLVYLLVITVSSLNQNIKHIAACMIFIYLIYTSINIVLRHSVNVNYL